MVCHGGVLVKWGRFRFFEWGVLEKSGGVFAGAFWSWGVLTCIHLVYESTLICHRSSSSLIPMHCFLWE